MTDCINLKERFGDRYRITFDEAYDSFNVPWDKRDSWYMQIPARKGTIYPHGGDLLAVEIDYHNPTANKITALPGVTRHQDGDYEKTFLFHVDHFDKVAELIKPYEKVRLSDEERARRAERMRQLRSGNEQNQPPSASEIDPDDEDRP